MIINNDLLLSIASILFVVCAVPQLIRNLRFKNTITQSILTNLMILVATVLTFIVYLSSGFYSASIFLILEMIITILLIIQIIIWRKNRKNKKIKAYIERTEGARTILRTLKGVK